VALVMMTMGAEPTLSLCLCRASAQSSRASHRWVERVGSPLPETQRSRTGCGAQDSLYSSRKNASSRASRSSAANSLFPSKGLTSQ